MMTAEQFYKEGKWQGGFSGWGGFSYNGSVHFPSVFEFADAHAAAQLAEKEREIARLHKLFCDLTPGGSEFAGDPDYCTKYLQQKLETQGELLKKKVIALRRREAELEQRWIAIGERLPEDGVEVLAMIAGTIKPAHRVLVGSGRLQLRKWDARNPNCYECERDVTHWQPLPSPPKVQP